MAYEIVNPYIQELKDVCVQYIEKVYVILDRVMGVTVYKYTDQNIAVNNTTHSFMVTTDAYDVRISPHIMSESVEVTIHVGSNIVARIELGTDGPVDEVYSKMTKDLRDQIKDYFRLLADIDIKQSVVSTDTDRTTVDNGGDDTNE